MVLPRYRMTGGTVGAGFGAQFYAPGGSSGGFTATTDNQRYINICQPSPTATPAVTPVLVVHLVWQGISQPNTRNTTETLTMTLRSTGGGAATEYTGYTTDASGNVSVPVGALPSGTYAIRVKGSKNLSNGTGVCTDTVTLTGGLVTNHDSGIMRAGDALTAGVSNFNVVNSSDFTTLKNSFGKSYGQPGYCACADFNQSDNVDATDFSLQKGNFGQAGCGPALGPDGPDGSPGGSPGNTPKGQTPGNASPLAPSNKNR
jgi:hypothetical protein